MTLGETAAAPKKGVVGLRSKDTKEDSKALKDQRSPEIRNRWTSISRKREDSENLEEHRRPNKGYSKTEIVSR